MSQDQPPPSDYGVTRQLQIDAVCVRFEEQWRKGEQPQIEKILQHHEEPLRSQLLRHLLEVEFEYRSSQGERLEIQKYLDRFPQDQSLIHIVCDEQSRRPHLAETEFRHEIPSPSSQLQSGTSNSLSSLHGRFLPGTELAGRYRIVSLLGKGGMGEVYRADDLRLGQTVALKFLPQKLARDQKRLERFQAEVRLTRQISHPNVCRVYDMHEVDGQRFLSMEFIDGEDLRTLLRRIGRLPESKGIQTAQQLCAGLAAAHQNGVLHRDLKPANIMIDGHGQARITDFGLARLLNDSGDDEIAGTPAYMAPEQLRRGTTTVQSDLYSLGLVLYELFTGQAVNKSTSVEELLEDQNASLPSRPSSLADEMDPAVERAILRCLAKEPSERPESAHAVAAALPGGDPLAAALAAGETPSPEMIAAAGGVGRLNPQVGGGLLAAVVVGLLAIAWLKGSGTSVVNRIDMSKHPRELASDARRIIETFGYDPIPVDSAWEFERDWDMQAYDAALHHPLRDPPSEIYFWYRQSPVYLEPARILSYPTGMTRVDSSEKRRFKVSLDDPPISSGMVTVRLDTKGRLLEFQAIPPDGPIGTAKPFAHDWRSRLENKSVEVLGFSMGTFTRTASIWNPPVFCDDRQAWESSDSNGAPIRVEAASYGGRPVFVQVNGDWTPALREQRATPSRLSVVDFAWVTLVLVSFGLVAYRYPSGKADRRGAFRLALYVFASRMLSWLLIGSHVPTISGESLQFALALAASIFSAAVLWLIYSAIESSIRRIWPRTLISWSRVLNGQLRDPLVGQHVLIGVLFGVGLHLFGLLGGFDSVYLPALLGTRETLGGVLVVQVTEIETGLFMLITLLLSSSILRRRWLAIAGFCVVNAAMLGAPVDLRSLVAVAVCGLFLAIPLIKCGLLTLAIALFCASLLEWPITTDTSAWYFGAGLSVLTLILSIASYGFYTSLVKKPLLTGS